MIVHPREATHSAKLFIFSLLMSDAVILVTSSKVVAGVLSATYCSCIFSCVVDVLPLYTLMLGHRGVVCRVRSRLSGRVQQPFLVESRGSRQYYFSPVPGSLLSHSRLDDSLSSTTSLRLRFNCWPNTRFLLFLHDLYTAS